VAVTPTPTAAAATTSLGQQFLDKYVTDQGLREKIQAALTGDTSFTGALQKFGGFKTPDQLTQEAKELYTRREGETARDAFLRRRGASDAYSATREQNYQSYKQPYAQAEALVRDLKAKGFGTPEEAEAAQSGLKEIKGALFGQYQAGRNVLGSQEVLTKQAQSVARKQAMLDRLGGGKGEKGSAQRGLYKLLKGEERRLQGMSQVASGVAESGVLPTGNMQTPGEAFVSAMKNMGSEAASSPWYEKNRGRATYDPATKRTTPYRNVTAGIPGYTGK